MHREHKNINWDSRDWSGRFWVAGKISQFNCKWISRQRQILVRDLKKDSHLHNLQTDFYHSRGHTLSSSSVNLGREMGVQRALLVYVVLVAGERQVVLAVVGVDDGVARHLVYWVAVVGVVVDGNCPAGIMTEVGGNVRKIKSAIKVMIDHLHHLCSRLTSVCPRRVCLTSVWWCWSSCSVSGLGRAPGWVCLPGPESLPCLWPSTRREVRTWHRNGTTHGGCSCWTGPGWFSCCAVWRRWWCPPRSLTEAGRRSGDRRGTEGRRAPAQCWGPESRSGRPWCCSSRRRHTSSPGRRQRLARSDRASLPTGKRSRLEAPTWTDRNC